MPGYTYTVVGNLYSQVVPDCFSLIVGMFLANFLTENYDKINGLDFQSVLGIHMLVICRYAWAKHRLLTSKAVK